ncbi:MAG: PrsW family intramembrane metalloprotease [Dictyoglomus sp. NZ13-RE01]|nr:MAG: PrsW family intramembrane metalloprotease [Dictyoglomus sp. NZ13-RE01]
MWLLILAIAPGIALSWYIYNKDRLEKEPLRLLSLSFLLGILVVPFTALIEIIADYIIFPNKDSILDLAFYSFFGIGLIEEGSKFLIIYKYLYPKEDFNNPFDGIVYSVMVGLGFATLENIFYVVEGGVSTAILRAILAIPDHFLFSLVMGYFLGLAKFTYQFPNNIMKAIIYPSFLHGIYDFLILAHIWWLTPLIFPFVYIMLRRYLKKGKDLISWR